LDRQEARRGAVLGDERRSKRLVRIGRELARNPGLRFPEAMETEGQLEGLYRFLNNDEVTFEAVHAEQTRLRCQAHDRVLARGNERCRLRARRRGTDEGAGGRSVHDSRSVGEHPFLRAVDIDDGLRAARNREDSARAVREHRVDEVTRCVDGHRVRDHSAKVDAARPGEDAQRWRHRRPGVPARLAVLHNRALPSKPGVGLARRRRGANHQRCLVGAICICDEDVFGAGADVVCKDDPRRVRAHRRRSWTWERRRRRSRREGARPSASA
jgi:hypothetical protein